MTFRKFVNEVKEGLPDFLPKELKQAEIKENTVQKNNGIQLTGISLFEFNKMSPTVYMEHFYQKYLNGSEMEDILKELSSIYQQHTMVDIPPILKDFSYENVKNKIYVSVCNAEKNKELLQDVPHELREDLALTYRILMDCPNGNVGSALIHNSHINSWGIDENMLKEGAWDSTRKLFPDVFKGIVSMIGEMILQLPEEMLGEIPPEDTMYVLTNTKGTYGAAYMFDSEAMERIAARLGGNLIILPSSLHEVIILPEKEGMDLQALKDMVSEINRVQLEEDEILSDEIYHYDATSHSLHMVEGLDHSTGIKFSM